MKRRTKNTKGKKDFKNFKDYKDKGKKSFFIAKDSDSSEDDEMVYIVVKYESDDEGDKMTLVSHVSKKNKWIIDIGCSHHLTCDKKSLNI